MNDLFPETIDRKKHGATWTVGNRQMRNFRGFLQSREFNDENWQFQIPWFSTDNITCSVYVIDDAGEIKAQAGIPIDYQARITIHDKKYGRQFWDH